MPVLRQPSSLAELALQTVGEVVRNTGQQMIASVCPTVSHKGASIDIEQKMESLFKFLEKDMPHIFADMVTKSALFAIADLVKTTKCMSYLFTWNGHPQCMYIIEKLIAGSVHSQIQVMDFSKWPKFMWSILLTKLHLMTSLNILKLHPVSGYNANMKNLVEENLSLLEKLKIFVYQGGCSDYMLAQLSKYCTKVQSLDTSLSSGVTDASIPSLIKLKHLRKLNVSCTLLSEEGCYNILTGLPNLESYACSKLSKPELLAVLCPNLSHVTLSYVTCDLAALAKLRCLRELSLCRCNCLTTNLNGLLETKGKDLVALHLKYVWNVDVVAITSHCTRLKKMTWEVYTFNGDSALMASDSMPHFHILEHLDITNFSPFIVSFQPFHYVNIKVLKLRFFGEICDSMIEDAISNNYLKHLEELRLYNCGSLTVYTIRLLLHHCDGLKVIGGITTWWSISTRELEVLKIHIKKNNINLTIE